jgi:hypothetical protein
MKVSLDITAVVTAAEYRILSRPRRLGGCGILWIGLGQI